MTISSTSTDPTVITSEDLARAAQIPDEEIERDIAETEREIEQEKQKAEGYRLIAEATTDALQRRMAEFRHDAARSGAEQRAAFVRFLRALLAARRSG